MAKRTSITDADVALAYAEFYIDRSKRSLADERAPAPFGRLSAKSSFTVARRAIATATKHGAIQHFGDEASAWLTEAGIALLDPDVAAQYRAAVARKVKIAS